jgi:glyoxylase-like metal-dependent hydrolase (beta-lactamase superfamily II)
MTVTAAELNRRAIPRADFGCVTVFFGDKNGKYPDANQVIVRGSDTQAAFDTPIVANHIGAEFDATDLVILGHVHEDHMAGLHRLPNAPLHVHEADLLAAQSWEGLVAAYGNHESYVPEMLTRFRRDFSYVPRPDAVGYKDGAVWDLGRSRVRAFHMPGHTAGHCVLLVEPEGVAFIGDIDLTGFGPYYGDASSSLGDFRRTLARVAGIPAKVWVTSHHRGVYTDRDHFLRDLAAYTRTLDVREQRLLELLRGSPKTLTQLVECRLLYPPGHQALWVVDAETRSISFHLEEMLAAGKVRLDGDGIYRPG